MNPYERRIIHSALQKDKYVETHSEGEEPYRKVVITLKDGVDTGYENRGRYSRNRSYGKNNYRKPYNKKNAYNRDESVEETVSFIKSRTNLEVSEEVQWNLIQLPVLPVEWVEELEL